MGYVNDVYIKNVYAIIVFFSFIIMVVLHLFSIRVLVCLFLPAKSIIQFDGNIKALLLCDG